jgi:hypothetical protein
MAAEEERKDDVGMEGEARSFAVDPAVYPCRDTFPTPII